MKKLLLLLLLCLAVAGCGISRTHKISNTGFAMDTFVRVDAYAPNENTGKERVNKALFIFRRTAGCADRYTDGGKGSIYEVNNSLQPVKADPLLQEMFRRLQGCSSSHLDLSMGPVIDVWSEHRRSRTVPAPVELQRALIHTGEGKYIFDSEAGTLRRSEAGVSLDLGSVAKGFAVDKAAEVLQNGNIDGALINAGGNIRVIGVKPDHTPWTIAIQHPRRENETIGSIELKPGQAAATSGDYQRYYEVQGVRYHHLLSTETGQPVRRFQSVTVIAPTALEADYNSTLLFLMDWDSIRSYLDSHHELDAVFVDSSGRITVTSGLERQFPDAAVL